MSKRINVILPESTLDLIDHVAKKGDRSRFIDEAVRFFIHEKARDNLRQQLVEEYQADAGLNLALAQEWFPVDSEAE